MKKPALIAILLVVLHLVTATTLVVAEGIPQATPKILLYEIKAYTYTAGYIPAILLIVSDNEIYVTALPSQVLKYLIEYLGLDVIHVKYDSTTNTLTIEPISLVEVAEYLARERDIATERLNEPTFLKVAGYLLFLSLPKPRALAEKIAGLSEVNVEFPYFSREHYVIELKMATVTIEFGKPLQVGKEYFVIERPKRITYKGYEAVEVAFVLGEAQGREIIRSDGIPLYTNISVKEYDTIYDIAFELVVEDDVGKVVSQAGLPVAYVIGAVVAVVAAVAATVLAVKLRRR